jgi:DNA-3-methyladenine glycosylase
MEVVLERSFYERPTLVVARELLGKLIKVRSEPCDLTVRIVETEAYLTDDPACHTYRGRTARNAVMFGEAGHVYVFFNYGVHFLFNIVTRPAGIGEAVLIRAVEPLSGIDVMRERRGPTVKDVHLTSGPGRLAQALGIVRDGFNGLDVTDPESVVRVLDAPRIEASNVAQTRRIGINVAAEKPWRFLVSDSSYVSKHRR